jgi:hypothetical protein
VILAVPCTIDEFDGEGFEGEIDHFFCVGAVGAGKPGLLAGLLAGLLVVFFPATFPATSA